jgi:hypothetical protein
MSPALKGRWTLIVEVLEQTLNAWMILRYPQWFSKMHNMVN